MPRQLKTLLDRKAAMRVLIAEDDRALGLFLSRGLEADGHRVHLVCDGGAAVEAFRRESPDLTILDLNMPVKDGERVLEEVRLLDADLPVLVLTARQEVDIVGNGGGGYEYTRAGNFTQDTNGNLVAANGMSVMGYPAVNGVVNTNAPLTAINVPLVGQVQQPQASTAMSMTANLDSATTAGTTFPAEVTVYDSLGESHVATVTFKPGAAVNTWLYSVALPAADYSVVGGDAAPAAITGTMTFDQNGNLTQVQPTGAANPSNVGTAANDVEFIDLNFNPAATNVLADVAAGLDIKWNLLGSGDRPNISQVDTASAVSGANSNGHTRGTFQSFTINSNGTVAATYSNGQTQTVGQIAPANVTNLQGLQLLGDGDYATTLASGTASIGAGGTSGLATIEDDALEVSNVNISTEFSDLIVAQRAFEANAKSVTTFDTVTQDTINMVH